MSIKGIQVNAPQLEWSYVLKFEKKDFKFCAAVCQYKLLITDLCIFIDSVTFYLQESFTISEVSWSSKLQIVFHCYVIKFMISHFLRVS